MGQKKPQPMQPLVWDEKVLRFQENAIVRWMLDEATARGTFDMNKISLLPVSDADWDQFLQLIGYSVSGAPFRDETTQRVADTNAEGMGRRRRRKPA